MDVLNVEYMLGLVPVLLGYLPLTLQLAGAAMVMALILACVFAVVRVLGIPVLNQLTIVFISFFRGTPLLVQLFLFYYGLPQLFSVLTVIDGVTATIMGLTLQTEAALSIGMTNSQLMRRIILPQATRVALPTLMNYFIDMIKATSLAFTLGVTELMGATQKEASGSFLYFEAFIVAAVMYWIVVEILSQLQKYLEIRLNKAYSR